MGLVDDVKDGLGDGVEDPIDDAGVDELPLAGVGDWTFIVSPNFVRTELKKQHHWE